VDAVFKALKAASGMYGGATLPGVHDAELDMGVVRGQPDGRGRGFSVLVHLADLARRAAVNPWSVRMAG
jgi:hypothetical protein